MNARLLILTALTTCVLGIQSGSAQTLAQATFAGGCFWCIEAPFDQVEGVVEAVSGYTGGERENPTYKEVSNGATRHIESVLVTFDPEAVSYSQLLDIYWRQFDPTDAGGSFYDRGHQYTSAIFYHDEEQRALAEASKRALDASGRFDKPIVTPIRPATTFYPAEDYHQDYYLKNSRHYKRYRRGSGRDRFIEKTLGQGPSGVQGENSIHQAPDRHPARQAHGPAVPGHPARRHRAALQKPVLEPQGGGHLRRCGFGRAPLQLAGQVPVGNRLAKLYPAPGAGPHRRAHRPVAVHGPHRGAQQVRRLAPGPRVCRRASPPRGCATASTPPPCASFPPGTWPGKATANTRPCSSEGGAFAPSRGRSLGRDLHAPWSFFEAFPQSPNTPGGQLLPDAKAQPMGCTGSPVGDPAPGVGSLPPPRRRNQLPVER